MSFSLTPQPPFGERSYGSFGSAHTPFSLTPAQSQPSNLPFGHRKPAFSGGRSKRMKCKRRKTRNRK
jgi:hypothetical protein